jgi:hypothetical protein
MDKIDYDYDYVCGFDISFHSNYVKYDCRSMMSLVTLFETHVPSSILIQNLDCMKITLILMSKV